MPPAGDPDPTRPPDNDYRELAGLLAFLLVLLVGILISNHHGGW